MKKIYTIGHSNHSIEYFLEILQEFGINSIIDVRSIPSSSYLPHFNKDYLSDYLKKHNIDYLFFGEEFGARRGERDLYNDKGYVDFNKVRSSERFQSGVQRINVGLIKDYKIALMCSEANPLDCHRFSMISYYLSRNGFTVYHILKDKTYITDEQLEQKLLKKYENKIPQPSLLTYAPITKNEVLDYSYMLINKEIAHFEPRNINEDIMNLFTIGFAGKSAEEFFNLLITNKVKKIIDIRLNNKSQLAGFAKGRDLQYFLKKIGNIGYEYCIDFAPTKELLDGYRKKEISWLEYEDIYNHLLDDRHILKNIRLDEIRNSCLLCSEHEPDKCHRRLLAERIKGVFLDIKIKHLR